MMQAMRSHTCHDLTTVEGPLMPAVLKCAGGKTEGIHAMRGCASLPCQNSRTCLAMMLTCLLHVATLRAFRPAKDPML